MVRSLLLLLMLVSCDEPEAPPLDGGTTRDSGPDGGSIDAEPDAGSIDAEPDAGSDPYCADELPSWSIRTSSTSAADDAALADDFAAAIEREAAAIDAALA